MKQIREEIQSTTEYWAQRAMSSASLDLTRLFVRSGMTKTQWAEKIGKSKAYISRVFNDDINFTIKTLVSLARSLNGHVEIRVVPNEARQQVKHESSLIRQQAYPRVLSINRDERPVLIARPVEIHAVKSSNDQHYSEAA